MSKYGKFAIIVGVIGTIVTGIGFLFQWFPQIRPGSHLIERANAGNIKAQALLADNYFKEDDIANSCYWYKNVSIYDSKYKGKAKNNLAYLYLLRNSGNEDGRNIDEMAFKLFLEAGDEGEAIGYRNAYIVLISNPEETFSSINALEYHDYKTELEEKIEKAGIYDHDLLCQYDSEWYHPETFVTREAIEELETDEEKYTLIAAKKSLGTIFYTYKRYKRKKGKMGNYTYLSIDT